MWASGFFSQASVRMCLSSDRSRRFRGDVKAHALDSPRRTTLGITSDRPTVPPVGRAGDISLTIGCDAAVTWKEVIRKVKAAGFIERRSGEGSHMLFVHPGNAKREGRAATRLERPCPRRGPGARAPALDAPDLADCCTK